MPRENKSLFALLGVLSLGPRSGYEVKKKMESSLVHFWREGYGQIYPNLKKLVERGWATVRTEKQYGKPDKNVYTITELGEIKLQKWLAEPIEEVPVEKNELLLKLFFGANVSITDSIAHIQRHKAKKQETLMIYNAIEDMIESKENKSINDDFALLTLRHGQRMAKSIITWCDESLLTLKRFEKGNGDCE